MVFTRVDQCHSLNGNPTWPIVLCGSQGPVHSLNGPRPGQELGLTSSPSIIVYYCGSQGPVHPLNGPRLRQELGLTSSPSIGCLDRVPPCVVVVCQVRRRAVLLRVLCPPLHFFLAPRSPPNPLTIVVAFIPQVRPRLWSSWSRRCGLPEAGVDDDDLP